MDVIEFILSQKSWDVLGDVPDKCSIGGCVEVPKYYILASKSLFFLCRKHFNFYKETLADSKREHVLIL
jgi:hypothetical protein